ncbi:hypothetical protein ABFS82_13G031000 [Erythranthe guttata]
MDLIKIICEKPKGPKIAQRRAILQNRRISIFHACHPPTCSFFLPMKNVEDITINIPTEKNENSRKQRITKPQKEDMQQMMEKERAVELCRQNLLLVNLFSLLVKFLWSKEGSMLVST